MVGIALDGEKYEQGSRHVLDGVFVTVVEEITRREYVDGLKELRQSVVCIHCKKTLTEYKDPNTAPEGSRFYRVTC